jgi:endonuclease YncB( thermonuclease family)
MRTSFGQNSFPCRIQRFRDGDTLIALIKLPFNVYVELPVRLQRIDSWELDGVYRASALNAADKLTAQWHGVEALIVPKTSSLDCYGRCRANIVVAGKDLAAAIVEAGLAWWTDPKQDRTARGLMNALNRPPELAGSHR